jgi:hypothetical protein
MNKERLANMSIEMIKNQLKAQLNGKKTPCDKYVAMLNEEIKRRERLNG